MVRDQTNKELNAISSLETIFQNCDLDEIENLFLLQIILKEERQIVSSLGSDKEYKHLYEKLDALDTENDVRSFLKERDAKSQALTKEIMLIKERKQSLSKLIKYANK